MIISFTNFRGFYGVFFFRNHISLIILSDPDCYELVYVKRNQMYITTDLPQEKTTFVRSEREKENG